MLVEFSQSDFYNLNLDKDRVRNLFNVNIQATLIKIRNYRRKKDRDSDRDISTNHKCDL